MSDISISSAVRTTRAQAIINAIDAGTGPGVLKLISAPRPATGAALTTQTVEASLTLSDPCADVVTGNVVFRAIAGTAAAGAAAIAWARIEDSDGNHVLDLGAGDDASSATVRLNNLSPSAGDVVTPTGTLTLTGGNP